MPGCSGSNRTRRSKRCRAPESSFLIPDLWPETAVLSIAVALAVFVGGCGGDDTSRESADPPDLSEEAQVTAAIEEAYGAVASGDGETFCARVTEDFSNDLDTTLGRGDCEDQIAAYQTEATEGEIAELASPELGPVLVSGSEAETTVNGDNLELVNDGGQWLLDDADPGG